MPVRPSTRAFTLVDLLAILTLTTLTGILAAAIASPVPPASPAPQAEAARDSAPESAEAIAARRLKLRTKDAMHARAITQALFIWAAGEGTGFPLPSKLDAADATSALNGRAKDTTANIFSLLVYMGMVSTEMCISPLEVNPNIKQDQRYEFTVPKAAMKPAEALWDPGFKADFTKGQTGNVSYAHLQPSDGRLPRWTDTYNPLEPVISNRAPQIERIERTGDHDRGWIYSLIGEAADSLTYKLHDPIDSWAGNVAYGDGHVDFISRLAPEGKVEDKKWLAYTTWEDTKFLDCYFVDEEDDKTGSNAFLGIFVSAGKSAKDFRAIWD